MLKTNTTEEIDRLLLEIKHRCDSMQTYDKPFVQHKGFERVTSAFKGWFVQQDPLKADPMHEVFLSEVKAMCDELEKLCKTEIELKRDVSKYLEELARILLSKKEQRHMTAEICYLAAAEQFIIPFLKLFSIEQLENLFKNYRKQTPKHLRLPIQTNLLEVMDKMVQG